MACFHSAPALGISIWPTMSSTTPSRIASLLATCLYSDIASTPELGPQAPHRQRAETVPIGQVDRRA